MTLIPGNLPTCQKPHRTALFYLKRAGGQSQYSALLASQAQSESEAFDALDRWIAEHLKENLRVDTLAERVHMSPRNFARAYAEKPGRAPAKAVEAIRVESSEEQMRCAFIRILGIPPREYRNRFATTV